jgi:hypothetical protein
MHGRIVQDREGAAYIVQDRLNITMELITFHYDNKGYRVTLPPPPSMR